jgi:VWFA-related protein
LIRKFLEKQRPLHALMHKTCVTLVAVFLLCAVMAAAQTVDSTRPPNQTDEVLKVFTELVQTDVMVFDKQGRFVKDLKRENFELRIDGKLRPIGFFDRIQAGTSSEEAQLAAARGAPAPGAGKTEVVPLDRGRPVFFFVDDMHLSVSSLDQTRKLLGRFIDRDLKQNDEAEIMSASGRLGFLQQLTDNKTVLRTAIERLTPGPMATKDLLRPPMSEYQALQIDRGDRDTMGFFVDALIAETRMTRSTAEDEVRRRASLILDQAAHFTTITLSSLDVLVRSCAKLPGRKLIFFISDGFFIDSGHSDSADRMRLLTSAAARTGAIIYSIDARGLIARLDDASKQVAVDPSHRLSRGGMGEIVSSQDGLNALARDSGGRALFNTNDLHVAVDNGLRETSTYYLLAWRPEHEGNSSGKFRRLEVSVVGRPDLTVRVRRGFFDLEPPANAGKRSPDQKPRLQTVEAKLREAIMAPYPERQIPVSLSLNYIDTTDKGPALTVSMKIPGEFLSFNADDKPEAQVDLAGALFDDRGQSTTRFGERVTLNAVTASTGANTRELTYSHTIFLGPGLYQVRVAARDVKTEHVGSANTWIEIPDLSNRKLALSSLLLGERLRSESANSAIPISSAPDSVRLSIDRRFGRDSFLRYVVFIYNATRAAADQLPDVVVQMQVLRDGHPVATTTLKKVSIDGAQDLQRLPYAAELPLEGFPAGHYVLLFTAIDRIARTNASHQIRFEID